MVAYHPAVTLLLVGGVAALSAVLAVMAWRARKASGNPKLSFVLWAFVVFCVKSVITVYALLVDPSQWTNVPSTFPLTHGHLEFLDSAFDLVIVFLLVAPFLGRK